MSDLEARRLARELLRTGLDASVILQGVADELGLSMRDALRALTAGRADFRYQSTVDRGVEFVPTLGPQHSIPMAIRPASTLHAVSINWTEPVPVATPLEQAQGELDAAIRRRVLGATSLPGPEDFSTRDEYYDSLGDDE